MCKLTDSLEAANELQADGVDVAVLHVSAINPWNEHTILAQAKQSGRLAFIAENNCIIVGLGKALAGLLIRNGVTPTFRQIALADSFLDAGALPTCRTAMAYRPTPYALRSKPGFEIAWLLGKDAQTWNDQHYGTHHAGPA